MEKFGVKVRPVKEPAFSLGFNVQGENTMPQNIEKVEEDLLNLKLLSFL